PNGATCSAPPYDVRERVHPGSAVNRGLQQSGVRFRSAGIAERSSKIRVPDSRPETFHLAACREELDRISDPGCRVFRSPVLAQRAIHPAKRRFGKAGNVRCVIVPDWKDVRDAGAEAVAIGETPG